MEKNLVSFGNYLLKKCKVQAHDLEGNPVYDRQVTDADLANWKSEAEIDHVYLPSRYAIGDLVKLNFFTAGLIDSCRVIKVHFTESKVLYDVEVYMVIDNPIEGPTKHKTRLYNIDSFFVVQ